MANEIYNSSDWGNGVCDNAIDWGVVYKDFAGCTPSFTNTYSLAFDGVDDFVDVGNPTELQITGALSISAWVKFTGNTAPIVSKYESGSAARPKSFGLEGDRSGSNHSPKFFIYNSGTIYETPTSVKVVDDGNWHHLLAVFNPSTYLRLYIDGNLEQENTTSIPATIDNDAANFVIGAIKSLGNPVTFFSGNIDEVAVWNSDQSANIDSIYSASGAVDLTSLNPIGWWRMGDNGSYKSPQWLILNNSNKDKVSNYSFQFDGVDDSINCGNDNSLNFGSALTVSAWVKPTNSVNQVIASKNNSSTDGFVLMLSSGVPTKARFFIYIGGALKDLQGTTTITHDVWSHILAVNDGTDLKLYVNGVLDNTLSGGGGAIDSNTHNFVIGARADGTLPFDNFMDEVAVWNSDQSANVASIYNSGVPTTITGAVAHWKMGEQATFSTNWTVPDAVGSNNGTSANMTIEDRTGDAPNSTSNALSYNMTESDRETDVPS